jgi:acetyl esterase/lipase
MQMFKLCAIALALGVIGISGGCKSPEVPTAPQPAPASAPAVLSDLSYKAGDRLSYYERSRCTLDLYRPGVAAYPTVVWFYGGGLTAGDKSGPDTVNVARAFVRSGIACAAVNYRLSPKVTYPAYVDDAAAAAAWVVHHIADYGGDSRRVFIGGHSAGGYLTAAIGFDSKFLQKYGVETNQIAGLLPVSPQVFTHFTIRRERGIPKPETTPVIDDAAPAYHIRADAPPALILIGDHDWAGRLEECQYFVAMSRIVRDRDIDLKVIANRTHRSIIEQLSKPQDPGMSAMLEFIQAHPPLLRH